MSGLPRYHDRLAGRDADIERLEAALADSALVTLSGPGGIGKTRLAAEIARRRRRRSTRWIDAGSVDTGSRLCDALLQGFAAQGDFRPDLLDPADRCSALLAEQEDVLCIVDRFEHLAVSDAGVIARWCSEAPGVTFLLTSRNALGLSGEEVVSLGPLEVDSARGLLASRSDMVLDGGDDAVAPQANLSPFMARHVYRGIFVPTVVGRELCPQPLENLRHHIRVAGKAVA